MVDGAIRNRLPAMHPGELLREDLMPELGCTRALAKPPFDPARACAGYPEKALRLGKLRGNGPKVWLALQTRYDLERLTEAKRSEIKRSRRCRHSRG